MSDMEMQRAMMKAVAETLDDVFNGEDWRKKGRNVGFALLTFEYGKNLEGTGKVNYVGNCERPEMLTALKELAARWEGGRE